MNTKFVIEVYHKERWGETPMYISTLGNKCYQIDFGGLFQARFFLTRKEAEKAVERVKKYIDDAAQKGYSTYCYGFDATREFHPIFGYFSGRMRSSDMTFNVREVELRFV